MEDIFFGFIADLIFNGIISVIELPGAVFHWFFRGTGVTLEAVVKRYYGINLFISIVFYGMIVLLVW
jgi:hypothetical protein